MIPDIICQHYLANIIPIVARRSMNHRNIAHCNYQYDWQYWQDNA